MNENMIFGPEGFRLTKISESLKLAAYPDPGTGGAPWTIGYGHTGGINPGDVCTEAQADAWLKHDIQSAEETIRKWVTVQLNQGQYDALADFIFNIGPGIKGVRDGFVWLASGNHSTFLRKLNAGDFAGAANEIPRWNLPPLPGLIIRRRRERELFLTGTWTILPGE